jgi:hypothetical protein
MPTDDTQGWQAKYSSFRQSFNTAAPRAVSIENMNHDFYIFEPLDREMIYPEPKR